MPADNTKREPEYPVFSDILAATAPGSWGSPSRVMFLDREAPFIPNDDGTPQRFRPYSGANEETNKRWADAPVGVVVVEDEQQLRAGLGMLKGLDRSRVVPKEIGLLAVLFPDEVSNVSLSETTVLYDASGSCPNPSIVPAHALVGLESHGHSTGMFKWNYEVPLPTDIEAEMHKALFQRECERACRAMCLLQGSLLSSDVVDEWSLSTFCSLLHVLSFGQAECEVDTDMLPEGHPIGIQPPENLSDARAEELSSCSNLLFELAHLWISVQEQSVIRFRLDRRSLEKDCEVVWEFADGIGLRMAVDAYFSGVPMADIRA